jgi:TIR domain
MIKVTMAPDRIEAGIPAVIEVRLKNDGPGTCTTVVFTMRLPAGLVLLEGEDRIERSAIAPGESFVSRIRLRAREPGRYELTSRSFSYRDHRGLPQHVTGFAAAINAAPRQQYDDSGRSRTGERAAPGRRPAPDPVPLDVFYAYSRRDGPLVNSLRMHLKPLARDSLIREWYDADITAGQRWEAELMAHLDRADLIFLLISAGFLASDFCVQVEMARALEREEAGSALVIPVMLRPVANWENYPFARLQALPPDGRPVSTWPNRDLAYKAITEGVRRSIDNYQRSSNGAS